MDRYWSKEEESKTGTKILTVNQSERKLQRFREGKVENEAVMVPNDT